MSSSHRIQYQRSLLASGNAITICPEQADKIQELLSNYQLIETFNGGLTAIVHHVEDHNREYNIKERRPESLVKNEDGELSFLNEILCRQKLEKAKVNNPILQRGIVKTIYADYHKGIIVSDWIPGHHVKKYTREQIRSLFELLLEIEKVGLFEWDLCSGNILFDRNQAKLYDFGYMYAMNINESVNGFDMESTLFHMVERFETRSLMGALLEMSTEEALDQYQMIKEEAIRIYTTKFQYLVRLSTVEKVNLEVIDFLKTIIEHWNEALGDENALYKLYQEESYRSYALDIEDDLMGKSCTKATIKKVEQVISMIHSDFDSIKNMKEKLWFDQGLDQKSMLEAYEERLKRVLDYQLNK